MVQGAWGLVILPIGSADGSHVNSSPLGETFNSYGLPPSVITLQS